MEISEIVSQTSLVVLNINNVHLTGKVPFPVLSVVLGAEPRDSDIPDKHSTNWALYLQPQRSPSLKGTQVQANELPKITELLNCSKNPSTEVTTEICNCSKCRAYLTAGCPSITQLPQPRFRKNHRRGHGKTKSQRMSTARHSLLDMTAHLNSWNLNNTVA